MATNKSSVFNGTDNNYSTTKYGTPDDVNNGLKHGLLNGVVDNARVPLNFILSGDGTNHTISDPMFNDLPQINNPQIPNIYNVPDSNSTLAEQQGYKLGNFISLGLSLMPIKNYVGIAKLGMNVLKNPIKYVDKFDKGLRLCELFGEHPELAAIVGVPTLKYIGKMAKNTVDEIKQTSVKNFVNEFKSKRPDKPIQDYYVGKGEEYCSNLPQIDNSTNGVQMPMTIGKLIPNTQFNYGLAGNPVLQNLINKQNTYYATPQQ